MNNSCPTTVIAELLTPVIQAVDTGSVHDPESRSQKLDLRRLERRTTRRLSDAKRALYQVS